MQLVEALVASTVFALSAGGALQISAGTAAGTLSSRAREQALERIEHDRLQLQGQWRAALAQPMPCDAALAAMEAISAAQPPPPGVQRALARSGSADLLEIRWQLEQTPELQRRRLISPLALGLCLPVVAPGGQP
jgi:hypothetical protein